MEYKGKLYGKIGNKYFDTSHTAEDWDKLTDRVKELEQKLQVSNTDLLHNVSQRSELLIDYMKWFDDNRDMYYEVSNKKMIDRYIESINCG